MRGPILIQLAIALVAIAVVERGTVALTIVGRAPRPFLQMTHGDTGPSCGR
jgi:hypothetical protein